MIKISNALEIRLYVLYTYMYMYTYGGVQTISE